MHLPTLNTAQLPARMSAERLASSRAESTGVPVVVDSLTTEKMQVTAEPDGFFQMDSSVRPVRVKNGAGWVPVDSTLSIAPDGMIRPAASTMSMGFSDGGSGPLVTLSAPGGQISYSWPTRCLSRRFRVARQPPSSAARG